MLKDICTDLKTSQKLKELGFDEPSNFIFKENTDGELVNMVGCLNYATPCPYDIKAYTLEQILEKLPKSFNACGLCYSLVFDYNEECIEYKWVSDEPYTADKIYIYQLKCIDGKSNVNWATTVGKLWIKLKESEIV